jgi:hypothetical protein
MASLETEKAKLREVFNELHDNVMKGLEARKAKSNGEGWTMDKDFEALLRQFMKAASTTGNMQDIENKEQKMLGNHVTAERLVSLQASLQRHLFDGIAAMKAEIKRNLIDSMNARSKKLKASVNPTQFATEVSQEAHRPVNHFKSKLITAFNTGKFLAEEDEDLIRPNRAKGDVVQGE